MTAQRHPVWDLPTRLFHWALVVLILTSWASHELEVSWAHRWSGYAVLTLILFRIVWGFVGSPTARFSQFIRGPGAVIAYLQGRHPESAGHNPLGALSVVALLLLVGGQAVSGLFTTDEVLFSGPFLPAVSEATAGRIGWWHETGFNVLLGLIALHISALLYYRFAKGRNLIKAMISGRDERFPGPGPTRPLWLALIVLIICAGAVTVLIQMAPEPMSYDYY
ncbi:MAG: cytochrome b/b6 domain-containing protein [Gammaproteobacteria bacterium]